MDVRQVSDAIFKINRLEISDVESLIKYKEAMPTHNLEYDVPEIEYVIDDPCAIQLICTHLLLKKLDALTNVERR